MLKVVLAFAVLLIFSTCKKETNDFDILTSKSWEPTLVDKNQSSNPQGGILYYAVLDCEKDDTYKFQKDGKLVINHGTNKCNDTEVATETVNYSYNKAAKELIIKGVKYTVADETKNQLKYYTAISSFTGFNNLIFIFE